MAKKVEKKAPAKKAAAKEEKPASKALVPARSNLPSKHADAFIGKPTGLQNVRPDDILMPRIKILQARNPECLKNNAKYIPGAKEGMFLDTSTKELWEELEIICCHFQIDYIKWSPRKEQGGAGLGFLGNLGQDPIVTKGLRYEDYRWLTKEGDHIVDTRQFYVLNRVGPSWRPSMFSMTDSQSTPARAWITMMTNIKRETSKGIIPMPAYFQSYKCKLVPKTRENYEWVVWDITPGEEILDIDPSGFLLQEAEKFCRLGMAGNLRHEEEERDEQAGSQRDPSNRSM